MRAVQARALAVDAVTLEVLRTLRDRGVDCVLLKGPTIASWLYEDRPRPYRDTDVLVDPARAPLAEAVLLELGFTHGRDRRGSIVSQPWRRGDQVVDLHRSVHGAALPPERVWRVLLEHRAGFSLGGPSVPALDLPARALLVALHADQHADEPGKPLEDLRRALARADEGTWQEACRLALRLRASRHLAGGLELLPEGRDVLGRLPVSGTAGRPLRLARIAAREERGRRRRVRAFVETLAPTPATMRWLEPEAGPGVLGYLRGHRARLRRAASRRRARG